MVRLGLSAALTPYPPPASAATAIAPQMIRRRFLPFLPFFPLPKPLPLLDIPDPRSSGLATTGGYASLWEMFPHPAGIDDERGLWSGQPVEGDDDEFECIGRRRSAWCTKAELSDRADSETPRRLPH